MSNFFDMGGMDWGNYDPASYGANEFDTWASGAGGGYGGSSFDTTGFGGFDQSYAGDPSSSWYSGLSQYMPSGNTAALLGLGGANLLGQYYGAQQQLGGAQDAFSQQLAAQQAYQNTQRTDIANAQNTALANWQKYGFPTQNAVQAGMNLGKQAIGSAMPTAQRSLDERLAGRGFGQGSGELARGYTGLEQQRVASMGDLASKMAQFSATPYAAPPITTAYPGMPSVPGYAQPLSFGERMANTIGGVTGTMGGIAAYDWLKNR